MDCFCITVVFYVEDHSLCLNHVPSLLLFLPQNAEMIKEEHEKRVALLRKQEAKGVDYMKVEKNKMEIESLESKMMVASQAIETTSSAIIELREVELFPQLLQLVTGLVSFYFKS